MSYFIKLILYSSFSMSIVIIIFLGFNYIVLNKFRAKVQYYSWLIIALGLIIPFRPFEINYININLDKEYSNIQKISSENYSKNEIKEINKNVTTMEYEENYIDFDIYKILFYIWIIGLFFNLIKYVLKHIYFLKYLKRWSIDVNEYEVINILECLKKELNIKRNINIKKCNITLSPMLIGYFKPEIIIPEMNFCNYSTKLFIKHEIIHYKRKDLLYKYFIVFVTLIHWFNPIVYLMSKFISILCEISCDDEVILNENYDSRLKYTESIINIAKNKIKQKTVFSTNFMGGVKSMKNRIYNIMNTNNKKMGISAIVLSAVLTTISGSIIVLGNESTTYNKTSSISTNNMNENKDKKNEKTLKDSLKPFEKYGITFDENQDKIYYNGNLVKCFIDQDKYENYFIIGYYNSNAESSIYLESIRDFSNNIVGIENMSSEIISDFDEEFSKAKLINNENTVEKYDNLEYSYTNNSSEKKHKSRSESLKENMKPFEKYGLIYDENKDMIFYEGQAVKAFVDHKYGHENWFMVGYFDDSTESSIYLQSIRDSLDNIIGIKNMTPEIMSYFDVYDDMKFKDSKNLETTEYLEELKELENLENIKNLNFSDDYQKNNSKQYNYYVNKGTTYIDNSSIKATNDFKNNVIPDEIKTWVSQCNKEKGAFVLKSNKNNKIDMWIYYNRGGSYPWNIEINDNTIELHMYDIDELNGNEGYTLINCQTPQDKNNINIYLEDNSTSYKIQIK